MCEWHEPMIPDNIITFFPHNENCPMFKNKTDYVEVVRCKDCGYYTGKFCIGMPGEAVKFRTSTEFCSRGRKKVK